MTDREVAMDKNNLLEVRNLCTYFFTDKGIVKAVDGLDFDLGAT